METLSYNSPAMLWGMALAAIPILIHLLFRRRFRRIDWAPMHYLKISIQRNRRRVRLEQLLLLLLRTALVLLLFYLVARPVMHAQGLGAWLGGRSRSSQLIVLDDSLSMGYRDGGRSAWEHAQELAGKVLETIGPKDRFTLVLASQPKTPLVREVELTNPEEMAQLIAKLRPAETFTAWAPVFEAVDELLDSGSYPIRELTVITDLRRPGWEDSLAPLGGRWASQQLQMRIFNVDGSTSPTETPPTSISGRVSYLLTSPSGAQTPFAVLPHDLFDLAQVDSPPSQPYSPDLHHLTYAG